MWRGRGRGWSAERLGLAALMAFVLVSVIGAWTPSHYEQAGYILGLEDVRPAFGKSRPARSDEWGVTTPYFQMAVAADLGPRETASPYRAPLKTFFALPSRDWSMAFKPDLWGFLTLDPARAFALHYALLAAAGLAGGYILLRQLGCRRDVAAATAGLLFFSQFVQVWWTSNAPALGLAAWPAIAFLWRGPWWARTPALAYATAAWLIGELYPPLIVASGLAFAVAIAAFRPDALRPGRLAAGVIGAAAGIAIAWLHYADLIPVMAATAYPGERVSDGGGVPLLQLAAHVFPYLITQRYQPLGLWPSNACEIAVAGSFLPLALACFCDHRALAAWAIRRRRPLAVWAAGLAVMLAWMLLPIPGHLAPGLNLVPPLRLLWGFGLLLLIGLAMMASEATWRLTRARVAAFLLAAAAGWAVSKLWLAQTPVELDRFDLVIVPVLLGLLALRRRAPQALEPRRLVLTAAVLTSVLTFGRFNPVQPAGPIFAPPASAAVETLRAYARAHPKGWVVAPGQYAATLNGLGVAAINHTLVRPDAAFFRAAFPELDGARAETVFNRYAHVMPALVWAPALVQEDVVAVPPDPFAIPLRADVAPPGAAAPPPGEGTVETAAATPLGDGRTGIMIGGWTGWTGFAPDQRLEVGLAPGAGRIVSASAFRLPRPELGKAAAGFGLRLVIETPDGAAPAAGGLRLVAVDGPRAWSLATPPIRPAEGPAVVWPTPPPAKP